MLGIFKCGDYMKKSVKLWIIKIAVIVLWVIVLFIPEIFASFQDIKVESINQIVTENTTDSVKYFNVKFSDNVFKGEIVISLIDEHGDVMVQKREKFSGNESNIVRLKIKSGYYSEMASYEVSYAWVKTKSVAILSILNLFFSCAILVCVVAVIRIDHKEQVVGKNRVEVYSGIFKHNIKIDGKKVFEDKWFPLFKDRNILLNASETLDLQIAFGSMNKITIESIDKQMEETQKDAEQEEPEKAENKSSKKKTTSVLNAGSKKVVSGASKKAKFTVKSKAKNKTIKK